MQAAHRRTNEDRLAGGLQGLLVGDALGVPYEFKSPEAIPPRGEIEMRPPAGFRRTYPEVPPGTWSDDGAQALCLLASLLDCNGLDLPDFAGRLLDWYTTGYLAVDGRVFDVGNQTRDALEALRRGAAPETSGPATERANGNGSLMRVLPLALWHRGSDEELFDLAMRQSLPTHGHLRSQLACGFYCLWARRLLTDSGDWDEAWRDAEGIVATRPALQSEWGALADALQRRPTGSGYVVDSLVSARFAFDAGKDYASVVREAIALGQDTDTTAAIAGGLAGIRYGREGIPEHWRNALRGYELLNPLLGRLLASSYRESPQRTRAEARLDQDALAPAESHGGDRTTMGSTGVGESFAMSTQIVAIAEQFCQAEAGAWDELLAAWHSAPAIGQLCSRYRHPQTGHTFLHLAARAGNQIACRQLIGYGADAGARTSGTRQTAPEVANQQGFSDLAAMLSRATEDEGSCWAPPPAPSLLPSSHFWSEAVERRAERAFGVAYGGSIARVPAGSRYFVDSFGRTLVGWHGTVDPPCGMDGDSMVEQLPVRQEESRPAGKG